MALTGIDFGLTTDNIYIYLLTTFRVAGLFAIAPFLGHRSIPIKVRFIISLLLGLLLFGYIDASAVDSSLGLASLLTLSVKEFLFGVTIGFLFQIIFIGVQFGGGIIGYQVGFALANVIDPGTSTNISIISQFKLLLATLIFLMINGHHVVLQALFESYRLVPVGAVSIGRPLIENLVAFSGRVFTIGIKIAAPVMVTLFVTDVALGIVARTMPQMNVFIVGFPLKIGIGLFVLATGLPLFNYVFTKLFNSMSLEAFQITKGFAG